MNVEAGEPPSPDGGEGPDMDRAKADCEPLSPFVVFAPNRFGTWGPELLKGAENREEGADQGFDVGVSRDWTVVKGVFVPVEVIDVPFSVFDAGGVEDKDCNESPNTSALPGCRAYAVYESVEESAVDASSVNEDEDEGFGAWCMVYAGPVLGAGVVELSELTNDELALSFSNTPVVP